MFSKIIYLLRMILKYKKFRHYIKERIMCYAELYLQLFTNLTPTHQGWIISKSEYFPVFYTCYFVVIYPLNHTCMFYLAVLSQILVIHGCTGQINMSVIHQPLHQPSHIFPHKSFRIDILLIIPSMCSHQRKLSHGFHSIFVTLNRVFAV